MDRRGVEPIWKSRVVAEPPVRGGECGGEREHGVGGDGGDLDPLPR